MQYHYNQAEHAREGKRLKLLQDATPSASTATPSASTSVPSAPPAASSFSISDPSRSTAIPSAPTAVPSTSTCTVAGEGEEIIPSFSDYNSNEDDDYIPKADELDEDAVIQVNAKEWVDSLNRDDLMCLTLVLYHLLVTRMQTGAAKLSGEMIGKCDRTVHEWRATFLCNGNTFPDSAQGKYQRNGGVVVSCGKMRTSTVEYGGM